MDIICSDENTYLDAQGSRGGLQPTAGNRVKPDYHFIPGFSST